MIRFVAGIDTDIGKSVVVGLFARHIADRGESVITQKLAQTGSVRPAEDIVTHRKLMQIPLQEEDVFGLTCPYVFPVAASPHLAARLAGQEIDPGRIEDAATELAGRYDHLLIEGVGGLLVPLNDRMTTLDLLARHKWPTVLVTSPRLGSINHTLMSLELIKSRGVPLAGLVYNRHGQSNCEIAEDSRLVFSDHMLRLGFEPIIVDLWSSDDPSAPEPTWMALIS